MKRDFNEILDEQDKLTNAFMSIQLSPKERGDLIRLCQAPSGIPVSRDKGNRVRGETIFNCSRIGRYLTGYFDGIGPRDQMMWVGHLEIRGDAEYWKARDEIKEALRRLSWF